MSLFKRREHEIPGLNTASLPDLIFTVLFFFMIVTHMRKVDLKVKYQEPHGTELTRLTKKTTTSYIIIGEPISKQGANVGKQVIQLNDKFATPADIEDYIDAERKRMSPEDKKRMVVSIKADKHTPMSTINEVKMALRRAGSFTINYSARDKGE
jgi:biopolymer transport protein ExbD